MKQLYNHAVCSIDRDERVIDSYKGKILFIGSNAKDVCQSFVDLNYTGLSLPSFSKSFYWLENQILSGAELPVAIVSDFELIDGNVFSFYYKINSNRLLKSIPFIVLAKNKNREEKIKALKVGIDDFYLDSFNAQDINDRIQFLKEFKKLTSNIEPEPQINLNHFLPLFKMPMLKRLVDILVAAIALISLSPVILLIALAIKLESKGPVLYISKRTGTGYKIFNFYKFRTMRIDADKELESVKHLNQYDSNGGASFFKIKNDPRTTRLGKFLRNAFFDELPQLINVLKGDMSLVGNRPLPLYEAEKLTKDQWARRFLAPAGMTGLWQITKRLKGNMSEGERMDLDITYAEKSSFVFDLIILFLTIPALIRKESY